jgi:uncharacterized membrane protein YdjX (TVP38/TMEM64 family)
VGTERDADQQADQEESPMTANVTTTSFRNFAETYKPALAVTGKLALGLGALAGAAAAYQPLMGLAALIKDREAVTAMAQGYGAWGPWLLGLAIALQVTFAVLPGHLLMLAGGYLYGFGAGFVITWTATVAASQLNFWLARSTGRRVVYRLAPRKVLEHWQAHAENKGFRFFLMTFVLPIFPSDLMAYVAGLAKVSPRRFLAANMLGHLPCALCASFVGAFGLALPGWVWAAAVAGSLAVVAAWRVGKRVR